MHITICDDDKQALEKYTNMLKRLAQKHKLDITFSQYDSGETLLFDMEDAARRPNILYLDISMPGTDGVTVAEILRQRHINTEIIFLTVSREHWQSAFDVDASNYVIKGADKPERFERVFLKAVHSVQDKESESILLTCAGQTRFIPLRNISYFEVSHNIVIVHYMLDGEKRRFEFYSSIGRLEEMVWGKGFVRTHRSYLVALRRIATLKYNQLILNDGVELPVGRTYYKTVREAIDNAKMQ